MLKEKTHSTIKAVVFDFGGVIEVSEGGHLLQRIAGALGLEYSEFRTEYFKHNHLSNVEDRRWEDMIMKVVDSFGGNEAQKARIEEIVEEHRSRRKINTELISFFKLLKEQGFKVGIFSNSNSQLRKRLNEKGIDAMVDEVVISAEIGHQKPHKEGFEILFKKLGVQPHEVIFIDDSPKSLEKASEIGYIPILFKDNEQLKSDLGKHGIFIKR